MPSPFPGMDPYLENPSLWPDGHGRLINIASELLLAQLRPKYFVQIDERLYLANDNESPMTGRPTIFGWTTGRSRFRRCKGRPRSGRSASRQATPFVNDEF